jgi:hypothetical protein
MTAIATHRSRNDEGTREWEVRDERIRTPAAYVSDSAAKATPRLVPDQTGSLDMGARHNWGLVEKAFVRFLPGLLFLGLQRTQFWPHGGAEPHSHEWHYECSMLVMRCGKQASTYG